jgi:hypothetical protein
VLKGQIPLPLGRRGSDEVIELVRIAASGGPAEFLDVSRC